MNSKNAAELEDWFLGALSAVPMPADDLLAVVQALAAEGDGARAAEWAALLQDALAEAGDRARALRLLALRAAWHGSDPAFRTACRDAAAAAFADRVGKVLFASAGFDDDAVAPAECVRRLEILARLAPDVLCHDRTWGFGVVRQVDDFYRRVTVDFTGKAGHAMSLAYAAEALELVGEDHLLARRHRDPAALAALARDNPAEVVRIALRSFGPLSAPLLQERLVGPVLAEAEWKPFWDQARKALKADPCVELPAKRNDPIRLLERAKSYAEDWVAAFRAERDLSRVLELLAEYEQARGGAERSGDVRAAAEDRLAFVIHGAEGRHPDLVVRAWLAAARLGLLGGRIRGGDVLDRLLEPGALLAVFDALPARDVTPFLAALADHDLERAAAHLVPLLPCLPFGVLSAAIEVLVDRGRAEACAGALRAALDSREARPTVLLWACRHLDRTADWALASPRDLLGQVVDALGQKHSGEQLKARNQLAELVAQLEWLRDATAGMDRNDRAVLTAKIRSVRGWDAGEQRSLLAKLIRLYPELEAAVVAEEPPAETAPKPRGRCTSLRSHRERREQYRHLVEEEIPENSREIGVARSYGDLRENAEYKFAKEYQGILMRRKTEAEQDLAEVRPTDFAGFATDAAGMGTRVTLEYANGRREVVTILGEWDRDEALGIVASKSRLAELLDGRRAGEELTVPGRDGEERVRVAAIEGLTPEIKAWIIGSAGPGG